MSKKYKGIVGISNEDYHLEKEHISSSNLKLLLKDPKEFYNEKILGHKKEFSQTTLNAFAEGSLAHTLILEPEQLDKEYRFFEGMRKQGKLWESFKNSKENKGYVLLSKAQKIKVDLWVEAYKKLDAAVSLVKGGEAELTLFGELNDIPLKVRADYINIKEGYIADVKTTSGPTDVDGFKYTIESFEYDLSAALYLMMFEKHFNKRFDFYFIVIGKREIDCQVFKLSNKTRKEGEQKVIKALSIYKKCKKSGIWKLEDNKKFDNIKTADDYEIMEV